MLKVNELPLPLTPDEHFRLSKLTTSNLCDALDKLKVPRGGCLDAGIKPLAPTMQFVGAALTVYAPAGNSLPVQYAMQLAQSGYALCVATDGYMDGPYIGDLIALIGQKMGLTGIVIDGYARDAQEIAAADFPLFCRGTMPRKPNKADDGEINGTINCAQVHINPGDIIMGDIDGVVAIPRQLLAEVLAAAEKKHTGDAIRHKIIVDFFTNNTLNAQHKNILPLLSKDVQDIVK